MEGSNKSESLVYGYKLLRCASWQIYKNIVLLIFEETKQIMV